MRNELRANILIVDDHPENILAMKAVLEDLGQNLVTASSGEEALRTVLHQDFAVILLDVQMGGIDGFETARLIKQREKSRHTPIIFVTAINRTEQHVFAGYDVGAVDYLFKPIVPEILKAKVTVFVDLFRKSAEIQQQALELTAVNAELGSKLEVERVLHASLDKITDLYHTSQGIGSVRTVDDVLAALLESDFLMICKASAIVFDTPWEDQVPENFQVYATASKTPNPSIALKTWYPLARYPFRHLLARGTSVLLENVSTNDRLPPAIRTMLGRSNVTRLMLFPLHNMAWYGVLELQFSGEEPWSADEYRQIERLAHQVLMTIDNLMLLQAEAEARADAERANQLKIQFLGMISHELRTPLASIKGFSSSLLADDVTWDRDTERHFLDIIDSEADKLTSLIEQLIDLSRLQAGTLGISPQRCDFGTVIDQAAVHLNMLAEGHHLSITLSPELPPVVVDSARIAQVLENLVGNAVKYSSLGTEIQVVVRSELDGIRVDVVDHGHGISSDEQAHVFDAFHQNKKNRSSRGAGLGLAICKGLIEAHSGQIWIEASSPSGTTVSFYLPSAPALSQDDAFLATLGQLY